MTLFEEFPCSSSSGVCILSAMQNVSVLCLCGGWLKKPVLFILLVLLVMATVVASGEEDAAADAVGAAFLQARQAAHLTKLERMGRNTFREKVCKKDMRFPSGWINSVEYDSSDPGDLPDSAKRLAMSTDTYKVASRFGIGVCAVGGTSSGRPKYSVVIALYESRWTSFWRIFWE